MEESSGAQYALQIALQTLRDRCQQFQQRIAELEEENLNLSKYRENSNIPLSEMDTLQLQVTHLTEQKMQLSKKVEMVTSENNTLWSRLSSLTQVKQNLDSKLIKINDTISNRMTHSNLVRSKTFTQDEPHLVFTHDNIKDENEKLSLELEDISLKLLNTIAKEKEELEKQCSQMTEIQINDNLFSNSYAFVCAGEEEIECDQVEKQLVSLKNIKMALLKQKEMLESVENIISKNGNNSCVRCRKRKSTTSVSAQTMHNSSLSAEEDAQLQSLLNWGTPENSIHNIDESNKSSNDIVKICPVCSKTFYSMTKFSEFQQHVENHFILESDTEFDVL